MNSNFNFELLKSVEGSSRELSRITRQLKKTPAIPLDLPSSLFPIFMLQQLAKIDVTNNLHDLWLTLFGGRPIPGYNQFECFFERFMLLMRLRKLNIDYNLELRIAKRKFYERMVKKYQTQFLDNNNNVPEDLQLISSLLEKTDSAFLTLQDILNNKIFKYTAIIEPNADSNLDFEKALSVDDSFSLEQFRRN